MNVIFENGLHFGYFSPATKMLAPSIPLKLIMQNTYYPRYVNSESSLGGASLNVDDRDIKTFSLFLNVHNRTGFALRKLENRARAMFSRLVLYYI